jgi:hypothetical protein
MRDDGRAIQFAQVRSTLKTMTDTQFVDPTFVYGALRSGTTLFRLILKSHPDLANPGEVDFLFDHLIEDETRRDGWRYDIAALRKDRIFQNYELDLPDGYDGLALLRHMIGSFGRSASGVMTLNVHRHAAKIARALPNAQFIHLLRDPRDVALSSIGMGWSGNSYYGVAHWIGTEKGWDKAAIAAERVLTVRFEILMAEVELELNRICTFLGVTFDPVMLNYHHGTNFGPPDPKIAFGWNRKATADEVALIEGRVGSLLTDRGYDMNGSPRFPTAFEARMLTFENRWKRWRFNMLRYGVVLFFATHAARALGLKSLYRRLRQRQENIRTARRK